MAKKFSKKAWSVEPTKDRTAKNKTGGDAPRKEQLKRNAKRQDSHGTERRAPGAK